MKKSAVIIVLLFLSGCGSGSYWADAFDTVTLQDGWLTYLEFYRDHMKPKLDEATFMERAKAIAFKDITSEQFVNMDIENCRLQKYWDAKNAEQAYPESDRPRNADDVTSVDYFLKKKRGVSPVLVARVVDKDDRERLIKLDGVHRIMAAHILGKKIRVGFIDLR